jgi:hypothetical protein
MKEEQLQRLEVRTSLVLGRFSFLHIGQCALRRAICLHVIFILSKGRVRNVHREEKYENNM